MLAVACLEPNPNAGDGDAGTGPDASTGTDAGTGDTGTDTGCDPCDFAFESLEFSTGNSQTLSIPKPDLPHTVPFATVSSYAPGNNADSVGYAMAWTDAGDAYELEITLTGAVANSSVSGVAVVLGFSDELGAPELQEVQVAADSCESAALDGLGDRVYIDALERYEPGDATILSYARSTSEGALEYCITESDDPGASLTYKMVMFALPDTALAVDISEQVLDSDVEQSADHGELGAVAQLVHLVGAREFDEGAEPELGYEFDCSAQPPYTCTYGLRDFADGVRVVAGGTILAIP